MTLLKSDRSAFSQKTVEIHESYIEQTIVEALDKLVEQLLVSTVRTHEFRLWLDR